MEIKELIASNETPNDHGMIVRNKSIDLKRFKLNPILLYNHDCEKIMGHAENLRFEGNNFIFTPVFTEVSNDEEVINAINLYKEGNLKTASIGGLPVYKKDQYGNDLKTNGLKETESFELYEISIVPIPSNPTAITLNAKLYTSEELLTLSTNKMAKKDQEKTEVAENIELEKTPEKEVQKVEAEPEKQEIKYVILKAFEDLKNFITNKPDAKKEAEIQPLNVVADEPQKEITELKTKEIFTKMETPELVKKEELAATFVEQPTSQKIEVKPFESFTKLSSTVSGKELIEKVKTGKASSPAEYNTVLHSIMEDGRYEAMCKMIRFYSNLSEGQIERKKQQLAPSGGLELKGVMERFHQNYVKLGTSADALASPETAAIAWLPMVINALFPDNTWRSKIPMFDAKLAQNNLGLIITNNVADPTVHVGAKPVNPSVYDVADVAVSLKMINFWLNPCSWTPLELNMVRYDKMAANWAQSIKKFNYKIDAELIYTLASLIPAGSFLKTSGGNFTIAANGIDAFNLNLAFNGSLAKPQIKDSSRMTQLFNKQNFPSGTNIVAVCDSTAYNYLQEDPQTASTLTRFNGGEYNSLSYGNVEFTQRSEVGLYDPATGLIKNPSSAFADTCTGANLFFVPDQIGIGVGKMDVFVNQDPSTYSMTMSMDTRMGIQPLRADFKGIGAYVYGDPTI